MFLSTETEDFADREVQTAIDEMEGEDDSQLKSHGQKKLEQTMDCDLESRSPGSETSGAPERTGT
jgi:hypothetical protein